MSTTNKPLAVRNFTSYRYKGPYGWIMIRAKDVNDALKQANLSLVSGRAEIHRLEVWDGVGYVPAGAGD